MHYLIYLRVSTKLQDERTQLDYCLRFIQQKSQNYTYKVYKDSKTSKKKLDQREGGKQLLAEMKAGDTVVAMRVDRLIRGLSETTNFIDMLDEKKVDIFLVEQPGINNKIMLGLYAGMAEEEVKLLRKRVKENLQAKKNRNERYCGKLPYGYAMHETRLVPIKTENGIVMKRGVLIPVYEEQKVVEIMQELHAEERSYQDITKTINSLGYRNREGREFQKMTIYRILKRLNFSENLIQAHTELATPLFR